MTETTPVTPAPENPELARFYAERQQSRNLQRQNLQLLDYARTLPPQAQNPAGMIQGATMNAANDRVNQMGQFNGFGHNPNAQNAAMPMIVTMPSARQRQPRAPRGPSVVTGVWIGTMDPNAPPGSPARVGMRDMSAERPQWVAINNPNRPGTPITYTAPGDGPTIVGSDARTTPQSGEREARHFVHQLFDLAERSPQAARDMVYRTIPSGPVRAEMLRTIIFVERLAAAEQAADQLSLAGNHEGAANRLARGMQDAFRVFPPEEQQRAIEVRRQMYPNGITPMRNGYAIRFDFRDGQAVVEVISAGATSAPTPQAQEKGEADASLKRIAQIEGNISALNKEIEDVSKHIAALGSENEKDGAAMEKAEKDLKAQLETLTKGGPGLTKEAVEKMQKFAEGLQKSIASQRKQMAARRKTMEELNATLDQRRATSQKLRKDLRSARGPL